MTIDVLVCRPDGSQIVEQREVPDNWAEIPAPAKSTVELAAEAIRAGVNEV